MKEEENEKMIDKNNIPKSWEVVKLGEVCETTSGGTPSRKISKYFQGNIPWVKSGELENNTILDTEEKISEEAIQNSSAKIFPKGTLLIALYGATIGKLAFLGVEATTNQAVCGIFKNEYVDSKYLFHFLFFSKQDLVKQSIGGAQPNISQTILRELDIPLPPLPEQHRIVSKIEELFAELDKGIESLKTTQQQLKVYRQAVLKWAFEGRLNYDVSDSCDKHEEEPNNQNNHIHHKNHSSDNGLPEGWEWKKLGEVSEMCLGKMLDQNKNKGTLQYYLRNISVRWGSFDLSDLEQMRFEKDEEVRYSIKKGDLIVCEGGEPGRCAIWNEAIPKMKIQKALHRVRVNKFLSEKYLFHFIFFSASTGSLEKYFTGTTIKHLTGRELKKIELPFPPKKEQEKIVSAIESRLSVCDKMEEAIENALQQAEALRLSILKKAFEGKLVEQNPKDEPASSLLERIRAAKENQAPSGRKVNSKRKNNHPNSSVGAKQKA